MNWLSKQNNNTLKSWLTNTQAPMLATLPDGTILWANHAFESLLGYSAPELIGDDKSGSMTWMQLTEDAKDLAADLTLSDEAHSGQRSGYYMQKRYRAKDGSLKRVVIDVLRHPPYGEFECFLVTNIPVDRGIEFAMAELAIIRQLMTAVVETSGQPGGVRFVDIKSFYKESPLLAWFVTILFSGLLFGNRAIEIYQLLSLNSAK